MSTAATHNGVIHPNAMGGRTHFTGAKHPSGPELMEQYIRGSEDRITLARRSLEWWESMVNKYPECPSFRGRVDDAKARLESIKEREAWAAADLREELIKLGLLPEEGAQG